MTEPLTKTYTGWAIELQWPDGKCSLMGRYYPSGFIPANMKGHVISIYKTRSEARQFARERHSGSQGGGKPRFVVRKVEVTVEALGDD